MKTTMAIEYIREMLQQTREFNLEVNKQLNTMVVPVFGSHKANLGGSDFFFVHNGDSLPQDLASLKKIHEECRTYANGFFKVPKVFRLKVPNIITLFVKEGPYAPDVVEWSQKVTRTMIGGEFQAVYVLDGLNMQYYGQGKKRTLEPGIPGEFIMDFDTIAPQNRGHYLVHMLWEHLAQPRY